MYSYNSHDFCLIMSIVMRTKYYLFEIIMNIAVFRIYNNGDNNIIPSSVRKCDILFACALLSTDITFA